MTAEPGRERLLGLLDHVADAILAVDQHGRVTYGNGVAHEWFADRQPIQDRLLHELIPEFQNCGFERACAQATATATSRHIRDYAPGLRTWLQAAVHPEPDGLTILLRDCTDHHRQQLAGSLVGRVATVAEASDGTLQALSDATATLRELTGYEVGKAWLVDQHADAHLVACHHLDRPELANLAETVSQVGLVPDGLATRALTSGEPLVVEDLPDHVDATRVEVVRAAGLCAAVYLPLQWRDGLRAVIGLLTTTGPDHDDWCAVLAEAHPRLSALAERVRTRQELGRLFVLAQEGLCITGADGWFHRVNPEMAQLLGRTEDDLLSRPFMEFAHPDDRDALHAAAERLFSGERAPFECRVLLPSGEERILSWTSRAVPQEGLIYSAARDVTAERRRERFEAEQRALLGSIALGAPLDETLNRLVRATEEWLPGSRSAVWLTGHDAEPTVVAAAARPDSRPPPPPPANWSAPFHGLDDRRLGLFALEPPHDRPPDVDEERVLLDAARLAGVAVVRDRAHTALRQSEERFRLMAAAATDAMWDWDLLEDVLWFNDGFAHRFGYPVEQVASGLELWVGNIHDDDRADVLTSIEECLASSEDEWECEYRFWRGDGAEAVVLDRGSIVRDAHGRAVRMVGGIWDLTAHREREERRERARRLASLGTLAGGVAHDLNNVLAPVLLTVELLRTRELDESTMELVERIDTSARRGATMIRQVLNFARGTAGKREPVDTRALIDGIVRHVTETFEPTIVVDLDVAADIPDVRGDATQLHQVLLNLIVNARDAMPDGGTLTVTAHEAEAAAPGDSAGRLVRVTVADTGTGMTEAVRRQALEPFFTTKGSSEGTGLGLATSLAIVEGHEGTMHLDSRPGEGTTVSIDLPTSTLR